METPAFIKTLRDECDRIDTRINGLKSRQAHLHHLIAEYGGEANEPTKGIPAFYLDTPAGQPPPSIAPMTIAIPTRLVKTYTDEQERDWYVKHTARRVSINDLVEESGAAWTTIDKAIKRQKDKAMSNRPPSKVATRQDLVCFLQARKLRAGYSKTTDTAYLDGDPIIDERLLDKCNAIIRNHPEMPFFQLPEPKAS